MKTRKHLLAAAGTIALLLTGTPLAAHSAMDQAGTAAPDRTAVQSTATPLPPKGEATRQFSDANTRSPLQFTPYASLNQLYKQIPQTRALVEQLEKDSTVYLIPAKGAASKISDDLVVFRDTGFGACGSLGCAHVAFMRQKDGTFTNVLDVSIPGPIEVKTVNGEQSLLLCTHEGQFVEWKMQGAEMEPVPVPLDAQRESCIPPADMAP